MGTMNRESAADPKAEGGAGGGQGKKKAKVRGAFRHELTAE